MSSKVVLIFESADGTLNHFMKAIEQYFHLVLFLFSIYFDIFLASILGTFITCMVRSTGENQFSLISS